MNIDETLDHTPLTFGRYKGLTPNEVSARDPNWLVWAYSNVKNKKVCSKLLCDACEAESTEFDYEYRRDDYGDAFPS